MIRADDPPTYLDWRHHRFNQTPKPCRLCGRNAFMTDEHGKACHKVCGEQELARKAEYYAGGGAA